MDENRQSEQYKVQAKECAERAKLADPQTERSYGNLERDWLDLANRASSRSVRE